MCVCVCVPRIKYSLFVLAQFSKSRNNLSFTNFKYSIDIAIAIAISCDGYQVVRFCGSKQNELNVKKGEKSTNGHLTHSSVGSVPMSLSINCVPCVQQLTAFFAMFSLQYDYIIESNFDDEYHCRFPGHELIKIKALKFIVTQNHTNTHTM